MMTDVPVEGKGLLYFPESECLENGFVINGDEAHFLHGRGGYHLQFPAGYLPYSMTTRHPTYALAADGSTQRFGGRSEIACANCGHLFAHVLTIDASLPDCGVTNVRRLEIIACLQCRAANQFIQYSEDGRAIDFEVAGEVFDFPPQYFAPIEVRFAPTPSRWIHPGSGVHENRYRLNGPPDWWQSAEYPRCPTCQQRMPLLLEIPSGGRTEDGHDFMWGDGGTGYVYWCDGCRISSLIMQCS